MASTYQRSLVKGIFWEVISFIITTIAVYIFYGDIITSLKFSIILSLIKIIFFFIHERAWKGVKWGKFELSEKSLRKYKNSSFSFRLNLPLLFIRSLIF